MSEHIATLVALARVRRESVERARYLARNIVDRFAQDALQKYAERLEKEAEELEAQIVVLKVATAEPGADQEIAALEPPPEDHSP
jgi:hypothetical protein